MLSSRRHTTASTVEEPTMIATVVPHHPHRRTAATSVLAGPRHRTTARVYRRRRAAASLMLAGVLALTGAVATGSLAGPGGVPAAATGAQPAFQRASIVARPGDTLWSIAQAHRGDVSHSRYVEALVSLNGGASIQAGQVVHLP
jgi:Tfp pilus assembly protein FimV